MNILPVNIEGKYFLYMNMEEKYRCFNYILHI